MERSKNYLGQDLADEIELEFLFEEFPEKLN